MRIKTNPLQSQRAAPYLTPRKEQHPRVGILSKLMVKDAPNPLIVSIKRALKAPPPMVVNDDRTDVAEALLALGGSQSAPTEDQVRSEYQTMYRAYIPARIAPTASTSTAPISMATRTTDSPGTRPELMVTSTSESSPSSSFIATPPEIIAGIPARYNVARTALSVLSTGSGLVLATMKDAGFCYLLYHSSSSSRRVGVKQIPPELTTRALDRLHVTEGVRAEYERLSIEQLSAVYT